MRERAFLLLLHLLGACNTHVLALMKPEAWGFICCSYGVTLSSRIYSTFVFQCEGRVKSKKYNVQECGEVLFKEIYNIIRTYIGVQATSENHLHSMFAVHFIV